jgi:hypothetical protein
MNTPMIVKPLEHGVARVFAIDLAKEDLAAFTARDADGDAGPWPLRDALGIAYLNSRFVEHFPVADLGEMGLTDYLHDGWAIPRDQLEPMRTQLEAVKGEVLLVGSSAFGDTGATLAVSAPLRHVATFNELPDPVVFEQMPNASAQPGSGPRTAPRQARADARRIGGTVFAVFMVLIALILLAVLL